MSARPSHASFLPTPAAHALFAALAALLCAGPLLHPTQPPVAPPLADPAQTQWNLWWMDQVLRGTIASRDGFFFTSALFHPLGADLSFHTMEYSYGLLLWPIRAAFGGFAQHTAALILATYLTAWWTWIATRAAGGNAIAAAAASTAVTMHSYRLNEAHHLNIFSTQFIPITLYLLLTIRERIATGNQLGRCHTWWPAVALALAAMAVLATSTFHTLACAILAVTFAIWFLWEHRHDRVALRQFFALIVVAMALAAPLAALFVKHWAAASAPPAFDWQTQARNSTEPWQWLLHPRLRSTIAHLAENDFVGESRLRFWYLPGYVLSAFLLVSFVKRRRSAEPHFNPSWRAILFLTLTGIVFMLLSFGPYLKLGPPADPNPPATVIPMPAQFLGMLPGLGTLRSLWHFGFIGTICFAIAGACAAGSWMEAQPQERRRLLQLALPVIILAEVFAGSIESVPDSFDQEARLLAERAPQNHAVFPMPQSLYEARGHFMYQQTIHGRPLIGGYLSRDPLAFDEWKRARRWPLELEEVMFGQRAQLSPYAESNLREDVDTLPIGALVIFTPSLAPRVEAEWRRLGYHWQMHTTREGWVAVRADQ